MIKWQLWSLNLMQSGCFNILFHAFLFNRLTPMSITHRFFRRGVISNFCVLQELLRVYLINKILYIGRNYIVLFFLTFWVTMLLYMHASLLTHDTTLLCQHFRS